MPTEFGVLAPLQAIMLRDSLAGDCPGAHVEQLELLIDPGRSAGEVEAAWDEVVGATEVLRMTFSLTGDEPFTWLRAAVVPAMVVDHTTPVSFENWLCNDRLSPLLEPTAVPWRVRYWPPERRLVWTFHHALLDGRSITAVLQRFLKCLDDRNPPQPSPVTRWTPPDAEMKEKAARYFDNAFRGCGGIPALGACVAEPTRKAVLSLGSAAASRLERIALALDITAATILGWTWGQAVVLKSGGKAAIVEQVRCGPPQHGCLGFSMNTLPVRIERARARPIETQLREFRARLLALRAIEAFPPQDLPPRVSEMTGSPWASVFMFERATLACRVGLPNGRVSLHECEGDTLTAAAYLQPDLRLEVEGPWNRELLAVWAQLLSRFMDDPSAGGIAFLEIRLTVK